MLRRQKRLGTRDDRPVDLAGRHAVDVGLPHHGDQGLLRALARLKELGK
jgi:hypothetical protein